MSFCEVGFIGQRNRLHLRLKLASMTDEACCVFLHVNVRLYVIWSGFASILREYLLNISISRQILPVFFFH